MHYQVDILWEGWIFTQNIIKPWRHKDQERISKKFFWECTVTASFCFCAFRKSASFHFPFFSSPPEMHMFQHFSIFHAEFSDLNGSSRLWYVDLQRVSAEPLLLQHLAGFLWDASVSVLWAAGECCEILRSDGGSDLDGGFFEIFLGGNSPGKNRKWLVNVRKWGCKPLTKTHMDSYGLIFSMEDQALGSLGSLVATSTESALGDCSQLPGWAVANWSGDEFDVPDKACARKAMEFVNDYRFWSIGGNSSHFTPGFSKSSSHNKYVRKVVASTDFVAPHGTPEKHKKKPPSFVLCRCDMFVSCSKEPLGSVGGRAALWATVPEPPGAWRFTRAKPVGLEGPWRSCIHNRATWLCVLVCFS